MTEARQGLAALGLAPERSGGPVDYYRIGNPGCGWPRWIVARNLDGAYTLYSGNLKLLATGASLRDILASEWLTS